MTEAKHTFSRTEAGAVIIVSLVVALRLLGIFLLLPIFSVYASRYPGANLPLAGVAFGSYALTQSLLQIPMGWASDRWGRKPLLLLGLTLFTLGSLSCGMAKNIAQLIIARAVQGSGAVASVAIATLADMTHPNIRAQAFAVTGITIGSAFMLGLLAGPLLAAQIGFSGLFYLLAALGALATLTAGWFFPSVARSQTKKSATSVKSILRNPELRLIYLAGFVLSFALNLFFFTYPLSWTNLGVERSQLWEVYLIIFIPSLLFVFPYVRYAERRGRLWGVVRVGWLSILVGYTSYLFSALQKWGLYVSGAAFFLGYTTFQPLLPSFLTQRLPPEGRGTATGFYNFAGFLGASLGGILAGTLSHIDHSLPEAVGLAVIVIWALIGLPNTPDTTI